MTISQSVQSMKQEIISKTQMLYQAWVLETVDDLIIRVQSVDAITFEYAVTDGSETFTCRNESLFCTVLGHVL